MIEDEKIDECESLECDDDIVGVAPVRGVLDNDPSDQWHHLCDNGRCVEETNGDHSPFVWHNFLAKY